jgi:Na+-driven multidrug efflux pump
LGKIELGVMSISQEILFIMFQFSNGIGIAGNIHIGQHLGANQPEKAMNITKATFFLNGRY